MFSRVYFVHASAFVDEHYRKIWYVAHIDVTLTPGGLTRQVNTLCTGDAGLCSEKDTSSNDTSPPAPFACGKVKHQVVRQVRSTCAYGASIAFAFLRV